MFDTCKSCHRAVGRGCPALVISSRFVYSHDKGEAQQSRLIPAIIELSGSTALESSPGLRNLFAMALLVGAAAALEDPIHTEQAYPLRFSPTDQGSGLICYSLNAPKPEREKLPPVTAPMPPGWF